MRRSSSGRPLFISAGRAPIGIALPAPSSLGTCWNAEAQATGGNYAFFREVPGLEHPGFPLAEMHADGSSVITKHPGTGGLVSVGTVTAQLLYEIDGARYFNPDVVTRFDTIRLTQEGPDRVLIAGVRGEPAPDQVKVCINYLGGLRNSMTFVITGLDIEAKAELAKRTLLAALGGKERFDALDFLLVRSDKPDAPTNAEASAELRVTVKGQDPSKVGRAFSNADRRNGAGQLSRLLLHNAPARGDSLRRLLACASARERDGPQRSCWPTARTIAVEPAPTKRRHRFGRAAPWR